MTTNNFQDNKVDSINRGNLVTPEDEPCLVETKAGQGFSVSYKGKFLYSKYSPSKPIVQMVENLQVLDGTVFLCFSPILHYGIKELFLKVRNEGKNFQFFLIEKDEKLNFLAKQQFEKLMSDFFEENAELGKEFSEKVIFLNAGEIEKLPEYLWGKGQRTESGKEILLPGTFRRVLSLNFSGANVFFQEFYDDLTSRCQNIIKTFWQNRATLIKLGRLFSKNLFKNLNFLPKAKNIENYFGKIEKPIFVLGAGPSLDGTLNFFKKIKEKTEKENLKKNENLPYIISVDAALPAMKSLGIVPDAVVAVESQLAIEKCYVGCVPEKSLVFADISSRYSLNRKFFDNKNDVAFFSSSYTESFFYYNLRKEGILPFEIPAMGSVGLTAVFLALKMRKNLDVPVFVSGLDFSFGKDSTHGKGTFQNSRNFFLQSRIKNIGLGAIGACFKNNAVKISSSENFSSNELFSDGALLSYGESFNGIFAGEKNLFNLSELGIDLGIRKLKIGDVEKICNREKTEESGLIERKNQEIKKDKIFDCSELERKIEKYISQEKNILKGIREFLVTGEKKSLPENISLKELLLEREFLYLHFPDGHLCQSENISFLKRVRTEIDWALKVLN